MISTQASHPAFAAHPIQGWTPDFIPKVLEDAPMAELQDELFPIPGDAAVNTAKALAAKEGLLTGISGGGTMYAALETAKKARVRRLHGTRGNAVGSMTPSTRRLPERERRFVTAFAQAPKGSVILAMLPDTGERYLSTPLFADIPADMNDEELSIAKSTPSFQLIPGQEPVLAA